MPFLIIYYAIDGIIGVYLLIKKNRQEKSSCLFGWFIS
jgi:hypothetical protein